MALPNLFTQKVCSDVVARIQKLSKDSQPQWGKMNVAQMLAHCNVSYEMIYDQIHPKPGAFKRFLLKSFIKGKVVSEKGYGKNSPTAPQFIIKDSRDFDKEKQRLIAYLNRTQELGEAHFDGKESHSFGPLNKEEWNNMLYKHIDHHLTQFGV